MNWIRDNEEIVKKDSRETGDFPLDELLEWDDKRPELRGNGRAERAERLTKKLNGICGR
jgi:seryl-tRNA synthetase